MPLLLLVLVIFMVVSAWRDEPDLEFEFPATSGCWGEPRPVDQEMLVAALARHGVELEREDLCDGMSIEPSAMFTNITTENWETPEADVIFASDGQVWCDLYRGKRFGAEVERTRVADEVVFRVLNVECRIYESDGWQPDRIDRAMTQLSRES